MSVIYSHFSSSQLVMVLFITACFLFSPSSRDLGSLSSLLSGVSKSFLPEDAGTFILQPWFSSVLSHLFIAEFVRTERPQEMSSDLDIALSCPIVENFCVLLVVQINHYSPHGNSLLWLLTQKHEKHTMAEHQFSLLVKRKLSHLLLEAFLSLELRCVIIKA